ncbi:MAG: iron hydrogenase small subunit [Bacilli bacterium]|nr:MAG: iron hydrogenase small subunit [Bacilli bacterium]
MNALYKSDKRMKIRCASMNPDIKDIYDNFLGEVGSNTSLKYLHTKI